MSNVYDFAHYANLRQRSNSQRPRRDCLVVQFHVPLNPALLYMPVFFLFFSLMLTPFHIVGGRA